MAANHAITAAFLIFSGSAFLHAEEAVLGPKRQAALEVQRMRTVLMY